MLLRAGMEGAKKNGSRKGPKYESQSSHCVPFVKSLISAASEWPGTLSELALPDGYTIARLPSIVSWILLAYTDAGQGQG